MSTITVDNFVDRLLATPVSPFPTKDFLTLTKKEAEIKSFKYTGLKKLARAIDSRFSFILLAPVLCISHTIGALKSYLSSFFSKDLLKPARAIKPVNATLLVDAG